MTECQDIVKSILGEGNFLGENEKWVEHYLIVKTKDGAMIINKRKHFEEGHTHISTMEQGEWLAKMALYKIVPRRSSLRDLESLIRIADNNKYRRKIERIYKNRQKAGKIGYAHNKFFGGV